MSVDIAEVILGAVDAARAEGVEPDIIMQGPDVVHGPKATCLVMRDLWGAWLVCVHEHGAADGSWYVSHPLTKAGARSAAFEYGFAGLREEQR